MLSSNFPVSQRIPCQNSDMYSFVRERLGKQIVTSAGDKFGPYLYRNIRNNVLISSWEKPNNNQLYTSYDIGMNTDALVYYKND
jgi:hypothetical protein